MAQKQTHEPPAERLFIIDMSDGADGVMRILETFVIAGARLAGLELRRRGDAIHLRVTVTGLDETRADRVRGRLTISPAIYGVSSGWVN